jgi:hypothetical protein
MRAALLIFAALVFTAATANANECWLAGNFDGRVAMSTEGFEFSPDRFGDGMLICFTTNGGTVSGSDLQFVRMAPSTLIGFSSNAAGLETVNVFQIDRERHKLFLTQSRIGTATVTTLLPDYAAAFVADVSLVN